MLRQLRFERCKDYILLETEFLDAIDAQRQKQANVEEGEMSHYEAELMKVEDIRGNPLEVGSLEEIIDDQHAIVSISGSEYYVPISSPSSTRISWSFKRGISPWQCS